MTRIIFLFLIGLLTSCSSEKQIEAPQLSIEYEIIPMDKIIFNLDTTNMVSELELVSLQHPSFSNLYFNEILPIPDFNTNEELSILLKDFISDKDIRWLKDTCNRIIPNLAFLKTDLDPAFKWYKYYFPERDVPDIYTFISGFQYQRFIFEDQNGKDAIGLGLDMFLGMDFPYLQMVPNNPNFSNFLSWTFDKQFIPKKIVELLLDDIMGEPKDSRLIDLMIHNGKKWYILSKLFPNEKMDVLTELKPRQLAWCRDNEVEIWAFFLDKDLFYESNFMRISKLIMPSPVPPPGMPMDAPGQTANYIGWQIIQKYMKKHPDMNLQDLINFENSQEILDQSKYKPRRR